MDETTRLREMFDQWCELESPEARVSFCLAQIIMESDDCLAQIIMEADDRQRTLQWDLRDAVMRYGTSADLYAMLEAVRCAYLALGESEWFKRRYPPKTREV